MDEIRVQDYVASRLRGYTLELASMPNTSKSSRTSLLLAALLFVAFLPQLHAQPSASDSAPICLDPKNPHYFLYQGMTIALISSGEHYGAVLNLDVDYHR